MDHDLPRGERSEVGLHDQVRVCAEGGGQMVCRYDCAECVETHTCLFFRLYDSSLFFPLAHTLFFLLSRRDMVGTDLLEMIKLFGRRDELTVPFRTGKWSVDHGLCHRFQYRS